MGGENPFFFKAPGNAWGVHRSMNPWATSEVPTDQRKGTSTGTDNHQTERKVLDQEIVLSFSHSHARWSCRAP